MKTINIPLPEGDGVTLRCVAEHDEPVPQPGQFVNVYHKGTLVERAYVSEVIHATEDAESSQGTVIVVHIPRSRFPFPPSSHRDQP